MTTFTPARIGTMHVSNRLLMAPVKTAFAGLDAQVTDRLIAYYRRRAEGGVGAIIVEPMFVDPAGKEHPKQLGIDDDDKIPGLRRLVDAIHAGGAKAVAHINHAGRAANPKASGRAPEAPSALRCPTTGALPEVLSTSRVEVLVSAFGDAARRAQEAGFDAIEVQFGLGYLIAQFLSPRTNQRDDAYGGDAACRWRFATDVVKAVHTTTEKGIPLMARISGTEKVDGGATLDDAAELTRWLEAHGVAAIHVVSGSACDSPPWYYQHMSLPDGANLSMARAVKHHTRIPVIAAGRLGEPEEIDLALSDGDVDFIALGRPLVADPDLPRKMQERRYKDVVLCGGCLQGCLGGVKAGTGIACIVNPELGHEGEPLVPLTDPRHVVVVGAGPAGLTAARIAKERGHEVTVLERACKDLGGQFALAYKAPGKQGLIKPLVSLVGMAERSGAFFRFGMAITAEELALMAPDVVLVATGATPIIPHIEGLESPLTSEDVFAKDATFGHRVLVIGGGLVGIEIAEFLGERGHEIVVVEMQDDVARDMEKITRVLTMKRIATLPVTILANTTVQKVTDGEVMVKDPDGTRSLGRFDEVAVAVGTRPRAELAEALAAYEVEVHVIGDAVALGEVQGAVTTAWEVARRL